MGHRNGNCYRRFERWLRESSPLVIPILFVVLAWLGSLVLVFLEAEVKWTAFSSLIGMLAFLWVVVAQFQRAQTRPQLHLEFSNGTKAEEFRANAEGGGHTGLSFRLLVPA